MNPKLEALSPGAFNGVVHELPAVSSAADEDELLDIDALKLADPGDSVAVRKVLTTVPIRRPNRQTWVRVHPTWRHDGAILQLKDDDRDVYIVTPEIRDLIAEEVHAMRLYAAMTRSNVCFLWPVRLPGSDGRQDTWSQSAERAAVRAMTAWVRVASNNGLGAYEVYEAAADVAIPEPIWPTEGFQRLFTIAFKGRVISSEDHVSVRQLLGRA